MVDQGRRSAARARARDAGTLGVDDARARRAGAAVPRRSRTRSAATSDRAAAGSVQGSTNYLRQLDEVLDRAPASHPSRSAACRSAASSRCATPRRTRIGSRRWCSPRRRRPGWTPNRAAGALAGAPRRGCRRRRSSLGAADAGLAGSPQRVSDVAVARSASSPPRMLRACARADDPAAHGRAGSSLGAADDVAPIAPRIDAPTLVVTGEDPLDASCPPETRGSIAAHPRRRCRVLERTGHMASVTRPRPSPRWSATFVGAHSYHAPPASDHLADRRAAWKRCIDGRAGPPRARGRRSRIRTRSTAARCTPSVVYQARKALTRIGCAVAAVQLPRRRRQRGRVRPAAPASRRTSAPALDLHGGAISRACRCGPRLLVRILGRARSRRRRPARLGRSSASRRRSRRRCRDSYTVRATLDSTKPKFFVQGEADEVCPLEGMWQFYGTARTSRRNCRDRRRRSSLRRQDDRRSARPSRTCSADVSHDHEETQSSFQPSARPSARRRAAHCGTRGPTRWRRPPSPRRCARVPALDPAEVDDVILGCAMPEARAGPERRPHRQPARRRAGLGVGGHRQPVLLIRPAGDRPRRRADHGRLRRRRRRRRHRVDEPGADGRPQGRAQPGAGRHLPRRLPHDRAGRREPRPRSADQPRGAGRVRARQPPQGDRRDRRRALRRTRSSPSMPRSWTPRPRSGARRPRRAHATPTKARAATRRSRRSPS